MPRSLPWLVLGLLGPALAFGQSPQSPPLPAKAPPQQPAFILPPGAFRRALIAALQPQPQPQQAVTIPLPQLPAQAAPPPAVTLQLQAAPAAAPPPPQTIFLQVSAAPPPPVAAQPVTLTVTPTAAQPTLTTGPAYAAPAAAPAVVRTPGPFARALGAFGTHLSYAGYSKVLVPPQPQPVVYQQPAPVIYQQAVAAPAVTPIYAAPAAPRKHGLFHH